MVAPYIHPHAHPPFLSLSPSPILSPHRSRSHQQLVGRLLRLVLLSQRLLLARELLALQLLRLGLRLGLQRGDEDGVEMVVSAGGKGAEQDASGLRRRGGAAKGRRGASLELSWPAGRNTGWRWGKGGRGTGERRMSILREKCAVRMDGKNLMKRRRLSESVVE